MQAGSFAYNKYPYSYDIAIVCLGFYAGGLYYYISADQFLSKEAMDLHIAILFAKPDPIGHTCETCGKVCRNIRVHSYCSCWVPIPGMVSGRWG